MTKNFHCEATTTSDGGSLRGRSAALPLERKREFTSRVASTTPPAPFYCALTYSSEPQALFNQLAGLPYAVWLDSGYPSAKRSRYDIITALPYQVLTTRGEQTQIQSRDNEVMTDADPFTCVQQAMLNHQQTSKAPFTGGALGYLSYDLGRRVETLPVITQADLTIPDMIIGLYDWALIIDHELEETYLISELTQTETNATLTDIQQRLSAAPCSRQPFEVKQKFQSNLSYAAYEQAFNQLQQHIYDGDCYEVNLTQRFSAPFSGSAWSAYCHLRTVNPAPFAAFCHYPECDILSLSPERFLHVSEGKVTTKPIKGTRPRGHTAAEDAELMQALAASEKDRAENLMIVDLLRNDLGRTCEAGSIKVPALFEIESFANVHHLVSTITGRITQPTDIFGLLRGCFPGGSITGAPKIRAMEIIEACEPHRRNIYCGSLLYIAWNGSMDSNIAIRTFTHHNQMLYCSAGGAIVADSNCEAEYQECFDKVGGMLASLEP